MPFATVDKFRIVRQLNLPLLEVETAMALVSDEAVITEIQSVLTELDTLQTTLNTERTNANNALIRADVLEWAEGGRTQGMNQQRYELRDNLATLLGVTWGYECEVMTGSLEYKPI